MILILLLVSSCQNKPHESDSATGADKFFEIFYEDILMNSKIVPLSQVASNVEYIKLETNEDCMIRRIRDCFFTDKYIFISNRDHILEFSRDGKFLQKIGSPGRGPGEIDLIRTMTLIPDKKLIAVQLNAKREMLYFSFEGEAVKTEKIPNALYIKVMTDGKYIAYDAGTGGSNLYTFSLINETSDTISAIKNYCTWENTWGSIIMAGSWPQPFSYRNSWYFKDKYNDTVYTVDSDRIRPSYSVNMGKYKLPDELRLERLSPDRRQLYTEKAPNYYHINLFEAAGKLFLVSECFSRGESKYLLYDKEERTGTLLVSDNDISTGFINDFDGGMDFWPIGGVNDNQVYMPINIMTLKEELEKAKSGGRTAKNPDKQKDLEQIISDSDILDNPVLMVVTLITNMQLKN